MPAPTFDLGPFRLERIAGKGATATVWRGVHRQRAVPVAIKVLSGIDPADTDARGRFVDEVRAMAALDHRAIIRLHDHGTIPAGLGAAAPIGAPYLVMDWHPDGTLKDRIGRLDFAALRETLATLLDALAHAHARGVVHRDLKPANVLLGAAGPIIADFGLVFSPTARHDRRAAGTPNYMAPEQVRGDWRSYGPWTDLYAVGCLAWTLATGRAPFAGRGARRAMAGHLGGVLPPFLPLMAVPPGLREWIDRLLARAAADRYAFAADAAAALARLPDPTGSTGPRAAPPATLGAEDDTVVTEDRTPLAGLLAGSPLDLGETLPAIEPVRPAGAGDRPPMPADWRRPRAPWTAHLPGCGTGLVELRVAALSGRAAERDRLWERLAEVVRHRAARAVLIEGGPGLGKSRLMTWLAERAHEAGQAHTLAAEHGPVAAEEHGLLPMLARHLRLAGLEPPDAVRRLSDRGFPEDVARRVVALDRPGPIVLGADEVSLDSEQAQLDALADGLRALAGGRAVVVRIDDAQWGADAIRFVDRVFDSRPDLPALFVITARAPRGPALDEAEADARRALDLLGHRPEVDVLRLEALDGRTHDAVAAARLPLTEHTRDLLARTTGGNPLFADELLRHWLHVDALEETPDGFRLRPDRPDAQPPSLVQLWRARLDGLLGDLRPDPMPALELAATLGARIDPDEWRAACRAARLRYPAAAVDRLLDHGLLRRTGDRLAFEHGLLRDALVERARGAGRAQRLHRACAEGLRALGDDSARRAFHLEASGQPDEAVPLWLRAARDHMQRGWHKDIRPAIALFDAALRHRPDDGPVLADAAVCRARLAWLAAGGDDRDQLDAARTFAERAIAAAPDQGGPYAAMAMVHHYRGEPLAALRRLEQAIERDPTDGESHGMAGRVLAETGPLDRAAHHLERALALGTDTVDLRIELARVHAYDDDWLRIHVLLWDPDPREAQRSLADIALARFGLWRGPGAREPWTTRPPVQTPNPVAVLFREVNQQGRAEPRHIRWFEERAARALAGGAGRRAVLFLQSVAEICAFGGDTAGAERAFVAAIDAGLTDRMWAMHCPLLKPLHGSDAHAAGLARIDTRLLSADEPVG